MASTVHQASHASATGGARLALLMIVPPGKAGLRYLCASLHSFIACPEVEGVMLADTDPAAVTAECIRPEVATAAWFCMYDRHAAHQVRMLALGGTPDKVFNMLAAHAKEAGFTHGLLAHSTEVLRRRQPDVFLDPVPATLARELPPPEKDNTPPPASGNGSGSETDKDNTDTNTTDTSEDGPAQFVQGRFLDPNTVVHHVPISWYAADVVQVATNQRFRPQADVMFCFRTCWVMGAAVPAPVPLASFRSQLVALPWHDAVIEMVEEELWPVERAQAALQATIASLRMLRGGCGGNKQRPNDPLVTGFFHRQLVWAHMGMGASAQAMNAARIRLRAQEAQGDGWAGDDGYLEALLCVCMLLRTQADELEDRAYDVDQAAHSRPGEEAEEEEKKGVEVAPPPPEARAAQMLAQRDALRAECAALLLEAAEHGLAMRPPRIEAAVQYAAHLQLAGYPRTALGYLAGVVPCLAGADPNPWLGDAGLAAHGAADTLAMCAADAKSPAAATLLRQAVLARRGRGVAAASRTQLVQARYAAHKTDSDASPLRQAVRSAAGGPWLPALVVHDHVLLPADSVDPDAAMTLCLLDHGTPLGGHAWLLDAVRAALGAPLALRWDQPPHVVETCSGVLAVDRGYVMVLCLEGDGCCLELLQLDTPPWRGLPMATDPFLGDVSPSVAAYLEDRSKRLEEWSVLSTIELPPGRLVLARAGQFVRLRVEHNSKAASAHVVICSAGAVPTDARMPAPC